MLRPMRGSAQAELPVITSDEERLRLAADWRNWWPVRVVQDGVVRSRIAAVVNIALLCAVVTSGAFALETPQRAAACDCATFTDTEAYEFSDVVFTGTLVGINTPAGEIVVSTDPERFVFDVDQVFKGEAQTRQSVVTAREGASCGLEIGGPGPFLVFARLDDEGISRGAVAGEVYSNLCSGTRPLADGALPISFGAPSPPVTVSATGEASSPPASSANGSSGDGRWIAWIAGVLVLGAGGAIALRRHGRNGATSSRTTG